MSQIDIYDQPGRLRNAIRLVEAMSISDKNKKLILDFHKVLMLERLSVGRQIKYLADFKAFILNYMPPKNLDELADSEIRDAVLKMEQDNSYSAWTKHGFKVVLRKFYKWLAFGEDYLIRKDYPRSVSWITPNIKKKERPKVQASSLLTESDVERLLDASDTVRDKALLSILYEMGARIGEIGNLRIGDVTRHKHGFLIDLYGKTGHRTPLVVMSTPFLATWLASHPNAKDPQSPLWVSLLSHTRGKALNYSSLRSILDRTVGRSGVKKRIYPHLFRHSRVTHLLSSGKMNEAQAKVYFGWVPESRMLSEYSHLVCGDVHRAILAIHGIEDTEEKSSISVRCIVCSNVNPLKSPCCLKCGNALKVTDPRAIEEENSAWIDEVVADPEVRKILEMKLRGISARPSNFIFDAKGEYLQEDTFKRRD